VSPIITLQPDGGSLTWRAVNVLYTLRGDGLYWGAGCEPMSESEQAIMHQTLPLPVMQADLAAFCQRWQIVELAVFGSALRTDFGPESDVDLLATFAPTATWSLLDHMRMELELVELFQREVDLLDRHTVEQSPNSRRRSEILNTAQVILAVENDSCKTRADHSRPELW
jgi:predicted nucleotidyltransferase